MYSGNADGTCHHDCPCRHCRWQLISFIMSVSTGTVGSTTVRQSNVRSKSNVSGTYNQALESHDNDDAEEEEEEETRIYLPLPPQVAHTTTRKVAELGPQGASSYAPGMLHRLALHGARDEVSALLQMKEGQEYGVHSATPLADVNMYDNQGMTALHCAAVSGMCSTCQVLLEERADPNIGKQNSGYTALHFACENAHLEVAKLLVKHRAGMACHIFSMVLQRTISGAGRCP